MGGDPTLVGWLTAIAYLGVAVLCVRAARALPGHDEAGAERRLRIFYVLAAVLLVLLGINKQLDLQTVFFSFGRATVRALDLRAHRRLLHLGLLATVGLVAAAGAAGIYRLLRGQLRAAAPALAGLFLVTVYVGARAASFSHFAEEPGMGFLDSEGLRGVEWLGLAAVCWGALRASRHEE